MKKFILTIALTVLSFASFGATLVPIQLLNPAGSSNGQTIVSSGPSSAPAWGANSSSSPYFQVTSASNQSIPVSTATLVVFGTVNFDPSGAWTSATNRWTPLKAGKYLVTIQLALQSNATTSGIYSGIAYIYKDGSAVAEGALATYLSGSGTAFIYPSTTTLVTMNGSTDYIQGYGYVSGTSAGQITTGAISTFFEAQYVGP